MRIEAPPLILSSLLYLAVVLCGMALITLIVLGEGARRGGEPLPRVLDRTAHALAALFVAGAAVMVWSDAGADSPLLDRGGLGLALESWPPTHLAPGDLPLAGERPAQDFAPVWSGDLSSLAAGQDDAEAEPSSDRPTAAPGRAGSALNPIAAKPVRVAR